MGFFLYFQSLNLLVPRVGQAMSDRKAKTKPQYRVVGASNSKCSSRCLTSAMFRCAIIRRRCNALLQPIEEEADQTH
jgi:hypothetical protein